MQSINKTITYFGAEEVVELHATLSQYYKLFNHSWMRFIEVDTDVCKEHPSACPLEPGATHELYTAHPPLARGTPFGWYRSKQVYRDAKSGVYLGCVDMRYEYCETEDTCKWR